MTRVHQVPDPPCIYPQLHLKLGGRGGTMNRWIHPKLVPTPTPMPTAMSASRLSLRQPWHEGDSSGTGSSSRSSANVVAAAFPTASDAADALDLSDDDTGSSSPSSANVVAPAFPTASDAADALDLSDDDDDDDDTDDDNVEPDSDDGDNDDNDNDDEDDEGSPPGSSQIHDLTPSAITLPIYGCEDFDYVDETWLMESERMMDMDTSTDSE